MPRLAIDDRTALADDRWIVARSPLALALVLALACATSPAAEDPAAPDARAAAVDHAGPGAVARCAALVAEFAERPWLDEARAGGLPLAPTAIGSAAAAPGACDLVAYAPEGWSRADLPHAATWTAPGSDPANHATLSYAWLPGGADGDTASYIDRIELAPARAGDVEYEWARDFDGGRERRRVILTREAGGHRLLVVRWRELDRVYLRCEVRFAGAYAARLPTFEAVCATARAREW